MLEFLRKLRYSYLRQMIEASDVVRKMKARELQLSGFLVIYGGANKENLFL